jgi:hypothetical protein
VCITLLCQDGKLHFIFCADKVKTWRKCYRTGTQTKIQKAPGAGAKCCWGKMWEQQAAQSLKHLTKFHKQKGDYIITSVQQSGKFCWQILSQRLPKARSWRCQTPIVHLNTKWVSENKAKPKILPAKSVTLSNLNVAATMKNANWKTAYNFATTKVSNNNKLGVAIFFTETGIHIISQDQREACACNTVVPWQAQWCPGNFDPLQMPSPFFKTQSHIGEQRSLFWP